MNLLFQAAQMAQYLRERQELEFWTTCGPDDQFSSPKQIRWSAALGKLLVAGYSNTFIHVRNADLSFFTKYFPGSSVYAVDSDANNIYQVRSSGIVRLSYSLVVGDIFSIASPRMIDASGDPDHIYVTSNNATDGHGVRKVRKSDMTVVASLLATGAGDGQFNNPLGVKYYGGYVYVCDFNNSRIVKLNASDLSFVENVLTGSQNQDLDTDGTYWYTNSTSYLRRWSFAFGDLLQVACVSYSICIVPDQGDGNGQTIAITDNTNSHIARYKCFDLTQVGVDVGSSGDGSASLFDPVITGAGCNYYTDEGETFYAASGAAPSKNGFTGIFFRSNGPHRVLCKPVGGLSAVTGINGYSDLLLSIKKLEKCKNLATLTCNSNPSMAFQWVLLNEFSLTSIDLSGLGSNVVGDLSVLSSKNLRYCYLNSLPLLTGSLSLLPATILISYLYSSTGITPASIAHLTAMRDCRIYSMSWLTAGVDLVLQSIPDSSYATPSLQIGGTNQAPSGAAWQAPADPGDPASWTGLEAIWQANHKANPWTVTYNGGVSEARLLGIYSETYEDGGTEPTWEASGGGSNASITLCKFTATAGTIGDIRIKMFAQSNVKVAIYDSDGTAGAPKTLLAKSDDAGQLLTAGWQTVQLTTTLAITAKEYWLAFKIETNDSLRYAATGGARRLVTQAYANPFPASISGLGVGAEGAPLYAIAGWGLKVV